MIHSSVVLMPPQTLETQLDGLLIDWYQWQAAYTMTRGFTRDQRTTGSYVTPGHWDWKNGAADDRAHALQVQAVDEAIQRIPNEPELWRTAIEITARNLALNIKVWYSPVMPPTKEGRDVLILEARNKLARELLRKGVIG